MPGRKPEARWLRAERTDVAPALAEMIHVSPLNGLRDVAARPWILRHADHAVARVCSARPTDCNPARHLHLAFHDIVEAQPDLVTPDRAGVEAILDFERSWTGVRPMLIHCWAGISRSSAAAYIMACDCNPGSEHDLAGELRRRAPFATPNRLMVALADDLMERNGAMVEAIARIGRGAEAFEGTSYQLPLRWPAREAFRPQPAPDFNVKGCDPRAGMAARRQAEGVLPLALRSSQSAMNAV